MRSWASRDSRIHPQQWVEETIAEAIGQTSRHDPVLPQTGGPAGNAQLTAWTGLALLALFLVEVGTVIDLHRFLSWHIVVGMLLVPLALLKTTTTGWRIVSYYANRSPYRTAGPPPMILRLLGPLVILFTLAALGSGIALIALGPLHSRTGFLTIAGYHLDAVGVHKAAVAAWAAVIAAHTLGRLIPALRIVAAPWFSKTRIPGGHHRVIVLIATLAVAIVAAAFVYGLSGPWLSGGVHLHQR